jgi:hypothetical protein
MEPEKVQEELERLWERYQSILHKRTPSWEEMNEARAILFLTGRIYCDQIAVKAIERRLHLLQARLSLQEFLTLIDSNAASLKDLRKDELFHTLERYYRVIKAYKNKYTGGKYYLEEEQFIKKYEEVNPKKELKVGYRGTFQ